jgi:hypothetical protein
MREPHKYRKLHVTIEAMQWDGSEESTTAIVTWAKSHGTLIQSHKVKYGFLLIPTLEGCFAAPEMSYIIRGVANEFYACDPKIFAKTYERAHND